MFVVFGVFVIFVFGWCIVWFIVCAVFVYLCVACLLLDMFGGLFDLMRMCLLVIVLPPSLHFIDVV